MGPPDERIPDNNPFLTVYRYYSSEKASDEKSVISKLSGQELLFKNKLGELTKKVNKFMSNPDGSKESPARTCNDLNAYNPELKTGFYWIDPNRGCTEDAVKVHCNFDGEDTITTCVPPTKTLSVEKSRWSSKIFSASTDKYFDEHHNLGKLDYTASHARMKYTIFQRTKDEGKLSPKALKDECAYMSKTWKSTVLEFSSQNFKRPGRIWNRVRSSLLLQ